jgi:hypothetical protein
MKVTSRSSAKPKEGVAATSSRAQCGAPVLALGRQELAQAHRKAAEQDRDAAGDEAQAPED